MPSSYTTSLRLTLPATGELSGQWGNTVNTGITELLDASVAGTTTITTWGGAGVSYTLSNNSGTADEARRMFIVATGTPGEAKNVICPAVSKMYVFRNDTTGGFALTLKTSGGTGVAVPAGQYKFLYCDGTNVVEAVNSLGPVASLSASQAVFTDASKNLVSNAITGTGNVVMSTSPTLVTPALGTPTALVGTNITGTATAFNINGTVGATTPAAGAFTTLSASSTVTLSGGTANGVLYLNGSKVATSGSALTFDGTSLSLTGSSGLVNALGGAGFRLQNAAATANWNLATSGLDLQTRTSQSGSASWLISDVERMTLASTGLSLASTSDLTLNKGTANGVLYLNGSKVATSGSALTFDGTNLSVTSPSTSTTFTLADNAGRTAVFRNSLGAGGNAEVGTTTNHDFYVRAGASSGGLNSLYLQAGGVTGYSLSYAGVSTWAVGGTTAAILNSSGLEVKQSQLIGYSSYAGIGTNGLAVAGNVGIGTSSPTFGLGTGLQIAGAGYAALSLKKGSAGTGHAIDMVDESNTLQFRIGTNFASGGTNLLFAYGTTPTIGMTLSSDGTFRVKGAGTAGSTDAVQFSGSAPASSLSLTSGGDLLVGTTDAAINSGTGVKLKAGANNNINAVGSDTTNTTSNYNLYSTGAAAYRFYVGMGGTIYATSTTITAISDQRLKENIRDLDAGLPEIMALKPRKFDWKPGKGKDKKNDRGWIAQEFEQVFPDMVDTWQDPAPEGEEPYKAVNADLIPVLVKAIQEQQALITDLRARVAALESTP